VFVCFCQGAPPTSMLRQIGDVERRMAEGLDHAAQLYAAVASKGEVDVSVQRCVSRLFLAQRAAEAFLAPAGLIKAMTT
jgi:hypothetical protein